MMNPVSVLVVEDEGLIALHIIELLTEEGFIVPDSFSSGEELIEYLKTSPLPQLILMDIGLTGKIDGIETARRVSERYSVPIIFLTADADQRKIQEIKEISPYGYLTKPIIRHELLTAIERALT
jgi:CheY-like chemotaxis protein